MAECLYASVILMDDDSRDGIRRKGWPTLVAREVAERLARRTGSVQRLPATMGPTDLTTSLNALGAARWAPFCIANSCSIARRIFVMAWRAIVWQRFLTECGSSVLFFGRYV